MDQESRDFPTLESVFNRIGAQNYQQLALFDKKSFLESSTSDYLYQQKDYLYYLVTKKKKLEITQQKQVQPKQLQFKQFHQLNAYLQPATWNLEIIGPSLSCKSKLLRDLAETMTKVLYVSVYEHYFNEKFKVVILHNINELFILLSLILETQEQKYQLIIIDGLNSLLYQLSDLQTQETHLEELHQLFSLLQKRQIQLVVSSVAKMKDNYKNYNQNDDQFIQVEKVFQKQIINHQWNYIWQAQLNVNRLTETKTIENDTANKSILKCQYFCIFEGKIKQEMKLQL